MWMMSFLLNVVQWRDLLSSLADQMQLILKYLYLISNYAHSCLIRMPISLTALQPTLQHILDKVLYFRRKPVWACRSLPFLILPSVNIWQENKWSHFTFQLKMLVQSLEWTETLFKMGIMKFLRPPLFKVGIFFSSSGFITHLTLPLFQQ